MAVSEKGKMKNHLFLYTRFWSLQENWIFATELAEKFQHLLRCHETIQTKGIQNQLLELKIAENNLNQCLREVLSIRDAADEQRLAFREFFRSVDVKHFEFMIRNHQVLKRPDGSSLFFEEDEFFGRSLRILIPNEKWGRLFIVPQEGRFIQAEICLGESAFSGPYNILFHTTWNQLGNEIEKKFIDIQKQLQHLMDTQASRVYDLTSAYRNHLFDSVFPAASSGHLQKI